MNVLLERDADLGLRRVRVRDRALARLRGRSLDRALAGGARPDSSVTLALHAARLYQPAHRQRLARRIRKVANAGTRRWRLRAPLRRRTVAHPVGELDAVAARLSVAGPVDVRGVATVKTLLADRAGPLYRASTPERLRAELRSALAALDAFE